MSIRYEDLKQLKKIAAVAKGRSTMKNIRELLSELANTPELKAAHEEIRDAQRDLAHLASYFDLKCRYCNKRLEFGYTCCTSCADERGP